MGLREDGSLGRASVLLASASSPTGRQVSISGRGARVVFALKPAHHIISWPARVPTASTDLWDGWRENIETRRRVAERSRLYKLILANVV